MLDAVTQYFITRQRQRGRPTTPRFDLAILLNPENEDVKRGNFNEPLALAEYEEIRGCILQPAAWVEHPVIFGAGATPDSFVNHNGLAQVKSPRPLKMTTLMRAGEIPAELPISNSVRQPLAPSSVIITGRALA